LARLRRGKSASGSAPGAGPISKTSTSQEQGKTPLPKSKESFDKILSKEAEKKSLGALDAPALKPSSQPRAVDDEIEDEILEEVPDYDSDHEEEDEDEDEDGGYKPSALGSIGLNKSHRRAPSNQIDLNKLTYVFVLVFFLLLPFILYGFIADFFFFLPIFLNSIKPVIQILQRRRRKWMSSLRQTG
jgi:hypothetical protein